MKTQNIIRVFLITVLLVINASCVFAIEKVDDFPVDFDKEKMAKDVANTLNEGYLGGAGKILAAEDIDFSKAIKIYVGTDIFALDTNNLDEIVQEMEQKVDYFYFYPYFWEDTTYAVTIQKNELLTKKVEKVMTAEEIKEYKLIEGTWDAVGIQIFPKESPYNDYYEVAKAASSNKNDKPILVGGLPYFSSVVALYANHDGNIDKIIPTVPEAVDYERLELNTVKNAQEYDYEKIKEQVNIAKKSGNSFGIQFIDTSVWIVIFAIFCICVVIYGAMKIHKHIKKT